MCNNVVFFFVQSFFSLFLPLSFREKSEWTEKAHSSLCSSTVNLDNSQKSRNIGLKVAFVVMCVSLYIHIQRSNALSIILLLWESKPNRWK